MLPLTLLLAVGCGKAPTTEIEAADETLDRAEAAGAAEYAPESFGAAEQARAELDTELKAQEEKLGVFRSYSKAQELAGAAKVAAEKAEQDAATAREDAREEAAALIADVRASLTETKELLERAPRGKGSEVDLAALQADLTGIENAAAELDRAFADGRYLEAKTGAEAAMAGAEQIKSEILRAMETAKPRTARRS
ncbi:MAG TPA: hypothetical protein VD788_12100 [Candidatus Polarisedimenticolaceae bacterium]|nr:hypothetical protein [Candidatus Polarisedimenticolaceae bacterium]